jgi:hypothetical protein
MASVTKLRKSLRTNPAKMHLISLIPEPAAYGAKDLTRKAQTNASHACMNCGNAGRKGKEINRLFFRTIKRVTHSQKDVNSPLYA